MREPSRNVGKIRSKNFVGCAQDTCFTRPPPPRRTESQPLPEFSLLHAPNQAPILDRFGDVRRFDIFRAPEIGQIVDSFDDANHVSHGFLVRRGITIFYGGIEEVGTSGVILSWPATVNEVMSWRLSFWQTFLSTMTTASARSILSSSPARHSEGLPSRAHAFAEWQQRKIKKTESQQRRGARRVRSILNSK